MPKSLFAAEVWLRRLNLGVAEQELNLFQFAAGQMAEPGAYAPSRAAQGSEFAPVPPQP
jgi:hypothetical protein